MDAQGLSWMEAVVGLLTFVVTLLSASWFLSQRLTKLSSTLGGFVATYYKDDTEHVITHKDLQESLKEIVAANAEAHKNLWTEMCLVRERATKMETVHEMCSKNRKQSVGGG